MIFKNHILKSLSIAGIVISFLLTPSYVLAQAHDHETKQTAAPTLRELVGRRQLQGERVIVKGGLLPKSDSLEIARKHRDSVNIVRVLDTLKTIPKDSLEFVSDSIRLILPDSLRKTYWPDSLKLTPKQIARQKRREERKPLISDSMSLRKVCWASLVLPGFGQIYNKQYWKLPILYGTVGAGLGMFFYENSRYKTYKQQYDILTAESSKRTEELNLVQSKMIRHNTWRQIFLIGGIASYIYFIGDAAVNYSTNEVSSVAKATTLSTICPGAGQIYNKSYWRFPIVLGGFATTLYCVDWNNRGYQRFKKAYSLKYDYDEHPEKYPGGSPDEFHGRYSTTFLKNLRNSYRRNRDLCIIITGALYILQIVDAHVDAHLRDYDITDNLHVRVSPTMNYAYDPAAGRNASSFGMNLQFTF